MKNFVQKGEFVDVAAPRTLSSGNGCLVGSMFGVATTDAASGANVNIATEGVFDLTKASGAITAGAHVYWDDSAHNVTTTSSSNTLIGVATQAAASGDATARVRLNGSF